jgi:DNA replication protein DnaD
MYYNTNNESGQTLKESKKKTETQEDKILEFFQEFPFLDLNPFDIQHRVFNDSTPITSVRRALTDLSNKGKLIKTNRVVNGIYGKNNHTWKLAK